MRTRGNRNASSPQQNSHAPRKWRHLFAAGGDPVQRIEDGMGDLPARQRYRLRCRQTWRCETCGEAKPAGDARVRCERCQRKRDVSKHAARVLTLWCHGAPEEQVSRLCIGPTPLRRWRGKANTLHLRCRRCGDEREVWYHFEACRCCGADLWGKSVEKAVRKNWIRATEAQRMEGLIG